MDIEQPSLYNCYFVESCQTGPSKRENQNFGTVIRLFVSYLFEYCSVVTLEVNICLTRLIIFSVTNNLPRLFQIDHLNKSHFLDKKLHQSFIIWQLTAVTTIPFTLLILINCKIMYHLKTSIQINGNINFTSRTNGLRIHTR